MNQILSVDMGNNKNNKKSGTKSIVVVFCIILILFALGIISVGVYSYMKNKANEDNSNLDIRNNKEPQIAITRQDANTINIDVSHDKGISYIEYVLNNEDTVRIEGNNKTKISKSITLKPGPYKIIVTAEDIAGITSETTDSGNAGQGSEENLTIEQPLTNGEGPTITLTKEDAKIKAVTESKTNIEKILYYWDDNKENTVEKKINATKNETLIDVTLEGIHTLYVTATDIDGNSTTVQQKIQGVNKPNVDITTDGNSFYIKATDAEMITRVEITLNKNDKIIEEVNSKDYSKDIDLENGENKLIVTVYNKNNVEKTLKVKHTK